MSCRAWIARLFATAGAIVVSAGTTAAGLLPVSVAVQPEAGNFRWTYSVVLPTDMKLQAGSYFTIYDFAGYQSGSGSVSSASPDDSFSTYWTLSTTNLGPTPDRLNPQDDPSITNLTFTYNGPTVPSGQLTLGNFAASSMYGNVANSFFTATNPTAASGQTDSNITSTLVPLEDHGIPPVSAFPEPGTLTLAALSLPLVGLGQVLRRRRAAN